MTVAPQGKMALSSVGHRGWICRNVASENIVRCQPSQFARAKLAQYPQPLVWPRYSDLDGAKALVEAVMTRDADALLKMVAMWPDYDLGLGEWGQALFAEHNREKSKTVTTLRKRTADNGITIALEVITDITTSRRQLCFSTYRGRTRLSRSVLREDAPPTPQVATHE